MHLRVSSPTISDGATQDKLLGNDLPLDSNNPVMVSCSSNLEIDSIHDEYIKTTAPQKRLKPKIVRNSYRQKDEPLKKVSKPKSNKILRDNGSSIDVIKGTNICEVSYKHHKRGLSN